MRPIDGGGHPMTMMVRNGIQVLNNERGQAMVEYVIVAVAVLGGVLALNGLLVPPINELYVFITDVVSLPIP
jgi:Flp pilus assembly pilin Flp